MKAMHFFISKRIHVSGWALCLPLILLGPQYESRAEEKDQQESGQKVWTLDDCISYALENNISLKQSRLTAESAEIDVKTARSALFPNLSFSTSQSLINRPYQESSSTVSGTEILYSENSTNYSGNYGLNASWNIYSGGANRKTIRQNELNSRIAHLDAETAANSIEESIAQTYVQILYAAESVKVNENTLEVSIAQMERGKQLLEAGSLSRADYAQLQSQVSSDKYQLVSSESALQDYKLQLKQLLELDQDEEMLLAMPEISDENVMSLVPSKRDIFNAALGIRPEIESGKLNVEMSELNIGIARAGFLPTLSLSAGIGTNHTTGTDFTFTQQIKNGWNNSIGLTLSVPIFSNRQNRSAVEKARIQYRTSELDLIQTHKDLYKSIENLWLDANSAQTQYDAAKEQVSSARTSYDLVNEQFSLGMKTTVELLTEKNNLQSAQQQLLQAKYMAVLNKALLRFYAGEKFRL